MVKVHYEFSQTNAWVVVFHMHVGVNFQLRRQQSFVICLSTHNQTVGIFLILSQCHHTLEPPLVDMIHLWLGGLPFICLSLNFREKRNERQHAKV